MSKKPPFNPDEFIDIVAGGKGTVPEYLSQHTPPTEEDFASMLERVAYMLSDIAGWGNALEQYDWLRRWVDAMWIVYTAAIVGEVVGDNNA